MERIPQPQLTGPQRHLLQIVADAGDAGIGARDAAKAMWPRSESWSHATQRRVPGRRRRARATFGQGAQLRAGEMLSRLHDAKMVTPQRGRWRATSAGLEYLQAGRLL